MKLIKKQLKYKFKFESTGYLDQKAWFIYFQSSMGTWIPVNASGFVTKEDAIWYVNRACR